MKYIKNTIIGILLVLLLIGLLPVVLYVIIVERKNPLSRSEFLATYDEFVRI